MLDCESWILDLNRGPWIWVLDLRSWILGFGTQITNPDLRILSNSRTRSHFGIRIADSVSSKQLPAGFPMFQFRSLPVFRHRRTFGIIPATPSPSHRNLPVFRHRCTFRIIPPSPSETQAQDLEGLDRIIPIPPPPSPSQTLYPWSTAIVRYSCMRFATLQALQYRDAWRMRGACVDKLFRSPNRGRCYWE